MQKILFDYIEKHADEYIEFLKDICSFEATARDKQELNKMVDFIQEFATKKGFLVTRTPFENCADFLTIDLNAGNPKGHLFLAHMDTVHQKGSFGNPCVKIEDGKMHGPGTIDCKGGIAIALLAMVALKHAGYTNHTRLILTSDEEISNVLGGEKEKEFFYQSVKGFKSALNCETSKDNQVVVSRKGILRKEITITGKGGHSGIDYFRCISAVKEAAYKIIELEKHSQVGGTTFNCGVIHGGTVANCVPEKCTVIVDVRVVSNQGLQQAQEILQKVVDTSYVEGTTATIKDVSMRPPFFKNEQTQKLFDQMQSISQKYNLGVLVPVESGGGSDSCYTQAGGVASLCGLGGCGQNVHTTKEFIVLESIEQRAKMLSAFCVEF